jgi:hypothetical protein
MRQLQKVSFPVRGAAAGVYGLAACVIAALFFVGFADRRPAMLDLTWARGLSHPRALALSPIEDTSFPLARRIGAVWVGHAHSQWIARYVRYALDLSAFTPEEKEQLRDYRRSDLEGILREIANKQPELIIEDVRAIHSWLPAELSSLQPGFLDGYSVIAEESGIRVLRSKSAAQPGSSNLQPTK